MEIGSAWFIFIEMYKINRKKRGLGNVRMEKQRNQYLDIAKGIGIILVVLGHMQQFFSYGGRMNQMIYSAHLPLFLMIGGYLMTVKENEKASEFVTKKFYRLIKPYFIFCIITILISWPGSYVEVHTYLAGMFFATGIRGRMDFNLPLWFMPMFFVGNCVFYLILRISGRFTERLKRMLAELCLVLLFMWLGTLILRHMERLPWSVEIAMVAQGLFLAGHWFRWLEEKLTGKALCFLIPTAFVLWGIGVKINGRVDMNAGYFGNLFWFYSTAIAGCFLILMFSKGLSYLPVIRTALAVCGRDSMYIMAYHSSAVMIVKEFVLFYMPSIIKENYGHKNLVGIGYLLVCDICVCLFIALLHKRAEDFKKQ